MERMMGSELLNVLVVFLAHVVQSLYQRKICWSQITRPRKYESSAVASIGHKLLNLIQVYKMQSRVLPVRLHYTRFSHGI